MTLDPFRRRYKFTEVEDQGEVVREGEREKEKKEVHFLLGAVFTPGIYGRVNTTIIHESTGFRAL